LGAVRDRPQRASGVHRVQHRGGRRPHMAAQGEPTASSRVLGRAPYPPPHPATMGPPWT
jgi:hypothetical protein